MKASVTWKGRMSFDGHTDSGFTLPVGTDPGVGGDNDGPRPLELLAVGLAGCTAMDVISILQKKRQQISAFEVRVDAARAQDHPRVMTSAVIEYIFTGKGVDENAVLRAIELSATRYCSAQAMLVKAFPMELVYTIYEEGQPEPVQRGKYIPAAAA